MTPYKIPPSTTPDGCTIIRKPFSDDYNMVIIDDNTYLLTDKELTEWIHKAFCEDGDRVIGYVSSNSIVQCKAERNGKCVKLKEITRVDKSIKDFISERFSATRS